MKKHSLLIMSCLLLLVCFIAAWYGDHLFNHLFVFALPIHIVLFAGFVALLVMRIRRVVRERDAEIRA